MGAIEIAETLSGFDEALESIPDAPAVFLLWPKQTESTSALKPYLARTGFLRRRLLRLFKERQRPLRLVNLRHTVERIEYWLTGSRLDASLRMYHLARRFFPENYLE